MPRYKPYDYRQRQLMSISLEDQIRPGTMEYVIHHLVENELDFSQIEAEYKNDDTGRPAIDPRILFKIILLAYSKGITGSRKIEQACKENILFMALSCGQAPDHSTISAFVTGMTDKITPLFQKILLVCDSQGLLSGTHFSLDGLKLPSNASKEWSGTFEELSVKKSKLNDKLNKLMSDHVAQDKANPEPGDEHDRRERQIKKLKRSSERIQQFLDENEPRMGARNKEKKSNVTDNDSAKMSTSHGVIQGYNAQALVDEKHQIIVHGAASGKGQDNDQLEQIMDGAKANMEAIGKGEDYFEGRQLSADSNYHSETNLKTVVAEKLDAYIPDNLFRKRDSRFKTRDRHKPKPKNKYGYDKFIHDAQKDIYTCPSGNELGLYVKRNKINGILYRTYRSRVSDCSACKLRSNCLKAKNTKQRSLNIQIKQKTPTLSHKMIAKIDTPESGKIYEKRIGVVEPVFGNIRGCKKLDRFTLRGQLKVDVQWLLYCMVHNVEKILNYGTLGV